MIETGIRTRELIRFSWRKPLCRPDILSVNSVNIYETAYTMLLLVLGILVSILLLIIERVIFYKWFIICKECGKRIEFIEKIRYEKKFRYWFKIVNLVLFYKNYIIQIWSAEKKLIRNFPTFNIFIQSICNWTLFIHNTIAIQTFTRHCFGYYVVVLL